MIDMCTEFVLTLSSSIVHFLSLQHTCAESPKFFSVMRTVSGVSKMPTRNRVLITHKNGSFGSSVVKETFFYDGSIASNINSISILRERK